VRERPNRDRQGMSRPRLPYRRILLPLALALTLAAESIAVVAAVDLRPTVAPVVSAVFAPQATRPSVREGTPSFAAVQPRSGGALVNRSDPRTRQTQAPTVTVEQTARVELPVRPSTSSVNKAKSESKAAPVRTASASTSTTKSSSYVGRNHMWFPAIGINRSVTGFACTSKAYPGDRVYRWGCAGANNVYLFGHAHSVFKPLHDAYVRGRLAKGMKVMYADGNGKVHTYKIAWWKVTTPTNGAFAYAAQSRPSMTLQTCVGAQSQYRLIVRLLRV
jgi:sortase (surface protein transpeptidase)